MFKNCVFRADVNTVLWIRAALRRSVKTMAQTAVAMLPAAVTITAVDWKTVIGTAALAGVVSILTSLVGLPELDKVS
ncbi:holin [Enterocloster lavalensis]|uniref:Holin, r1t family n=1 Tax=Enterocloster lavalensis TaxID=460384 RepID=A0A1I0GJE2_9FIRM|nr:holin [Enterocloster lavalensis]SET71315.1 holin, r1t family [Enterocloster lavalensis]